MDLKQIMTGKNPQSLMLEQTRGLKAKWEKTGLLEGVGSESSKHGMAVMLENQAKQLLDEATRTGTTGGSEEWAGVALPLVRRIFGSIAAKEFVSVQPMNLPSGLIFYMDFKYGSTAGKDINRPASGSSMFGALGTFGKDSLDVRAFDLQQSGSGYVLYPQYTVKNGSNVVFVAEITNASWSGSSTVGAELAYFKQPVDYNRGDFEDKGSDLPIPEVELELKSEPIVAKTRKLKAIWTPELAQDLNAYHSVDAEAELTQMLSEYISLEIDLEILEMLQQNAFSTEYWSARVGYDWTGTGFAADSTAVAAGAYTKNTWYQTLGIKLQKISNKIHQLTMRGGANFIVVSPIGFKGSNFFETGAVYAPYVPLIMTPLVYDPTNFTPRRGVMTRYAKKIVRPEFYGKIIVDGLEAL